MADIDIQKKTGGSNLWFWVLGLLIAAALIWLVAEAIDTDEDDIAADQTTEQGIYPETTPQQDPAMADRTADRSAMASETEEYLAFIDNMDEQGEMGLDHEFTSSALMHLSEALGATVDAEGNGDLQLEATRDVLEQRAQEIQQDPTATNHSQKVQAAFTAAADLMGQLQEMRYPDLNDEVSEVRQAAQAVSPNEVLLDQREEVHEFFSAAGDVLEEMSERSRNMASRDL